MRVQTMKFNFLLIILAVLQAFACDTNGKNLENKTLYVGFNGLSKVSKMHFFEDKITIQNSWLKYALTAQELTQLINQVNFENQFVLVYSFGKRPNASGKIIMNYVRYTTDIKSKVSSIEANINIGVVDKIKCNISENVESYPFIIELVERPKESFKLVYGGDTAYNFPDDGCLIPMYGKPTSE